MAALTWAYPVSDQIAGQLQAAWGVVVSVVALRSFPIIMAFAALGRSEGQRAAAAFAYSILLCVAVMFAGFNAASMAFSYLYFVIASTVIYPIILVGHGRR